LPARARTGRSGSSCTTTTPAANSPPRSRISGAADKHARIVVTGAFDPNPSPFARPLFEALDGAIAVAARAEGARFAPLLATFDGALCTLTLLCSDGDAHPSDAGYQAIADRVG
jgi:hypothetical protein